MVTSEQYILVGLYSSAINTTMALSYFQQFGLSACVTFVGIKLLEYLFPWTSPLIRTLAVSSFMIVSGLFLSTKMGQRTLMKTAGAIGFKFVYHKILYVQKFKYYGVFSEESPLYIASDVFYLSLDEDESENLLDLGSFTGIQRISIRSMTMNTLPFHVSYATIHVPNYDLLNSLSANKIWINFDFDPSLVTNRSIDTVVLCDYKKEKVDGIMECMAPLGLVIHGSSLPEHSLLHLSTLPLERLEIVCTEDIDLSLFDHLNELVVNGKSRLPKSRSVKLSEMY